MSKNSEEKPSNAMSNVGYNLSALYSEVQFSIPSVDFNSEVSNLL